MLILSTRDASTNAAALSSGFAAAYAESLDKLGELITRHVWSPCVWEGGRRLKAKFMVSELFVFDFDDGTTLEDMRYWAAQRELAYVIGLTKSHGVEKRSGDSVKPPCDRFRLVIPAESACTDRALFESNMRRWVKRISCDRSCVDAARFYFPCTSVYAIGRGRGLPWTPEPQAAVVRRERSAVRLGRQIEHGVIPKWIREILRFGVPAGGAGGRHTTCCKLGAKLHAFGLSEPQIIDLVMQSPLAEIGAADVERAVRWGVRNAHRA